MLCWQPWTCVRCVSQPLFPFGNRRVIHSALPIISISGNSNVFNDYSNAFSLFFTYLAQFLTVSLDIRLILIPSSSNSSAYFLIPNWTTFFTLVTPDCLFLHLLLPHEDVLALEGG